MNQKNTNGRKSSVKTAKAQKPEILEKAEAGMPLDELLKLFGRDGVTYEPSLRHKGYGFSYGVVDESNGTCSLVLRQMTTAHGNSSYLTILSQRLCHRQSSGPYRIEQPTLYVAEDGSVWSGTLTVALNSALGNAWDYAARATRTTTRTSTIGAASLKDVKRITRYVCDAMPLQSDEELRRIIENVSPYAAKWVAANNVAPIQYLLAPYLETLHKAGYVFTERLFRQDDRMTVEAGYLNRLCQQGTSPATIFKTTKAVYKVLGPHERDLRVWDVYRKMDKFGRISQDAIRQTYDRAMSVKNLDLISQVLAKQYNGKPVFDWDTLANYLNRVDRYEAIGADEALQLLRDYLSMCQQLQMRPRIDGDSLKREHDVAARLCRRMRNDELAQQMMPACDRLKKYNYYEAVYFIRGIESFDDLLDEATQQHSCLVSYGEDIAKGTSRVFVLREVSNPKRSLITVELSPDGKTIRQALTAYNKQIRNKSQREFLQRWLAYVGDVDKIGRRAASA